MFANIRTRLPKVRYIPWYGFSISIIIVYAADMPSTLPPVLLIRRLVQHALYTLLLGLRAIAVAVIWLAVLPWATVWTWRMYFSMGESTYALLHLGILCLLTRC